MGPDGAGGEDRTKPVWGAPANPAPAKPAPAKPAPAKPAPAKAVPDDGPTKAEAARLARQQAKEARAADKAARAGKRRERAAARATRRSPKALAAAIREAEGLTQDPKRPDPSGEGPRHLATDVPSRSEPPPERTAPSWQEALERFRDPSGRRANGELGERPPTGPAEPAPDPEAVEPAVEPAIEPDAEPIRPPRPKEDPIVDGGGPEAPQERRARPMPSWRRTSAPDALAGMGLTGPAPAMAAGPARRAPQARSTTGRTPAKKAATKRTVARKAPPKKAAARKAPAKKATSRTGAKRSGSQRRPSRAGAFRKRYGVVHDVEGPRVRLGLLWFFVALAALLGGTVTAAAAYGAAAAVAAAQTARVWRKRRARPNESMAAAAVGVVAAGACFGPGGAGLGLLGAVALAFVGAAGDDSSPNPRLADVGWTLQAALPPAVVAMSMVLLARQDQGSAISLLLLVSAFEAGDFLIGSGARNPYEGPAAGAASIVVVAFIVSTIPISTLSFGEVWLLGGAVVLLAPAGQLVASALLPAATSPASALRRLDSLLVTAPLWAWAVTALA